jgi:glycosyltransferase involved in cell wall biosynthesis
MRILYVTPWGPSLRFGGGLHCYANARALCCFPGASVDYVGPVIEPGLPDLPPEAFGRRLARPYGPLDKAKAALRGAATSLVSLFEEFFRRYGTAEYDLVFVESTHLGFVFGRIGPGSRTICSVHNVETDYLSFNATGLSRLAARNCRKAERQTLESCRMFLAPSQADWERLTELYGVDRKDVQFWKHVVCSRPPEQDPIAFSERDPVLAYVGSLRERFNEVGLREFVLRCWPTVRNGGCDLVVAGSNPSPDLVGFLSRQPGVRLVANPQKMEVVLRRARMLLLPDTHGTGMKLRVAEAMSLGVPVVGTAVGLRGYEDVSRFGRAVDSVGEMGAAILELLSDPVELASLAEGARETWSARYSREVFTGRLHRILGEIGFPRAREERPRTGMAAGAA